MKKMRLALIGFGNLGREFCRILEEKEHSWEKDYGFYFPVTVITTASRGSLLNPEGINLKRAIDEIKSYGRFQANNPDFNSISSIEACRAECVDLIFEISTLNIENGQPAKDHITEALGAGKHVITANKGPLAFYYNELEKLAASAGRFFLFEGTVMDGAPLFNLVRETLPGVRVKKFRGILNSTTNFILCAMEQGMTFSDALRTAQEMGWAEADPTMDIEGWDAAAKTAALLNVLMKGNTTPQAIARTGIKDISSKDIKKAKENNQVIRLICQGYLTADGKARGSVAPQKIPVNDRFAAIEGTTSIIEFETDLAGSFSIIIDDPKISETAYALISDLLTICKKLSNPD